MHLAIDIGGTFIDSLLVDPDTGAVSRRKVATDHGALAEGVLDAIDRLGVDPADVSTFVHGTTLGVNAVVERDGATTGLVTNEGFEDVLELGRETVPDEDRYDMGYRPPEPLVPRRRRVGVPGRIDADGEVETPLDEAAVRAATDRLVEEGGVESIAVCFLHAYRNPAHERAARDVIRDAHPAVSVSISSDIVSEYREYERTSTTTVEAYIKPRFESYIDGLLGALRAEGFDGRVFVTRSGGGAFPARAATDAPVHTIMSGPAGGLIGCASLADRLGTDDYIALDMGGTTTDACVATDGRPSVGYESEIEGRPVLIPRFDIRSIGAGGGSVAWADKGLLRVGPRSAGAYPGPACYGRGGTDPTVTDAGVVVGYLAPDRFLGGEFDLDADRARAAIRRGLAAELDLSVPDAASGVFRIAVSNITNAVRSVTVERGLDPREFTLFAYGGAGPMVVPMVGRELGAESVVVPRYPAEFSSWGMLRTDVVHDGSRTHIEPLSSVGLADLEAAFAALEADIRAELEAEGFGADDRQFERAVEMRYRGQEHAVEVSADDLDAIADLEDRFEERYRAQYNHLQSGPVETVTVRVRGVGTPAEGGLTPDPDPSAPGSDGPTTRESYCVATDETVEFAVRERAGVSPGDRLDGPAIVREPTATTVVHSDQRVDVEPAGHLRITPAGGA